MFFRESLEEVEELERRLEAVTGCTDIKITPLDRGGLRVRAARGRIRFEAPGSAIYGLLALVENADKNRRQADAK